MIKGQLRVYFELKIVVSLMGVKSCDNSFFWIFGRNTWQPVLVYSMWTPICNRLYLILGLKTKSPGHSVLYKQLWGEKKSSYLQPFVNMYLFSVYYMYTKSCFKTIRY